MAADIKVLVVDDSVFMRRIITKLLLTDERIAVIGEAKDGLEAIEKVKALRPDVVTLDVEMPKLDGIAALQRIMMECPTPVIMVSSLTQEGAEPTVKALLLGAFDFVPKPSGTVSLDMYKVRDELVRKVKLAKGVSVGTLKTSRIGELGLTKTAKVAMRPVRAKWSVVIGSSTGGPSALHQIVPDLPAFNAGYIVVQHMPPGFTKSLATRLDSIASVSVKEAADKDAIEQGKVLVAPGGYHLVVKEPGIVELDQGPPRHGVRPSVDVTLESAADVFGSRVVGVVLTGMGFDGAKGAAVVKKKGGKIIAQDQSTCVVYGMPRAVIEMGLADEVVPVNKIAEAIRLAVSA